MKHVRASLQRKGETNSRLRSETVLFHKECIYELG